MNQTTRAVSREKPSEMSRVPHHGSLSKPSTEGPPRAQSHTQGANKDRQFFKKNTQVKCPPSLVTEGGLNILFLCTSEQKQVTTTRRVGGGTTVLTASCHHASERRKKKKRVAGVCVCI